MVLELAKNLFQNIDILGWGSSLIFIGIAIGIGNTINPKIELYMMTVATWVYAILLLLKVTTDAWPLAILFIYTVICWAISSKRGEV